MDKFRESIIKLQFSDITLSRLMECINTISESDIDIKDRLIYYMYLLKYYIKLNHLGKVIDPENFFPVIKSSTEIILPTHQSSDSLLQTLDDETVESMLHNFNAMYSYSDKLRQVFAIESFLRRSGNIRNLLGKKVVLKDSNIVGTLRLTWSNGLAGYAIYPLGGCKYSLKEKEFDLVEEYNQ